MWSLFEAAQLRIDGEDILEEAHDFTYTNLKSIINQLNSSLAGQINQSLRQPLHKAIPRIGARSYISFYKEDPSHNKELLAFANLDFNMLQKLHQKEVGSITKWWKRSDFATKVFYARDRVVEAYFWPFAMSSDPKHSTQRRKVGKLVTCTSFLDDTYDVYGTIEELELFKMAIQRMDISCIASLPECMKVVFNAIAELCAEIESLTTEGGKSSLASQYVKQAYFKVAEAYFVEAKWCHESYIPIYDEYDRNIGLIILDL
ncbi:hypothetical protein PIB30_003462 [Stylosanthes scabra]|uniref:Terpene synthase metal-binding domain-containing protein n=1 Tax=Stylosanthes scabra TaxID=79078 RepID=A0ABU6V1J9_9FABA|nr:hypothetical protein [Stylosanthes scabra]